MRTRAKTATDRRRLSVGAALLTLGVLGCTRHPSGSLVIQLAARHPDGDASGGPAQILAAGDSVVVSLGRDTLILRHAELVVRQMEIAAFAAGDCEPTPDEAHEACPVLEGGPIRMTLPLGTAAESIFAASAPADSYSLIQFQIQAPDSAKDAKFLSAHPDLAHTSIRVRGTYSRSGDRKDFVYTSDFSEREELALMQPVSLPASGTARLTIGVDLARWFLAADKTALIDPTTANWGQPNEQLVRDNIRTSLGAFPDDNRDGLSDASPPAAP